MTDNHWSYRPSTDVAAAMAALNAKHVFIRPHCPWQNGKVERFNRTLQIEWAYRQVFLTNAARRAGALAGVLQHWATPLSHRRSAPGQPTVMNVSAEYT